MNAGHKFCRRRHNGLSNGVITICFPITGLLTNSMSMSLIELCTLAIHVVYAQVSCKVQCRH